MVKRSALSALSSQNLSEIFHVQRSLFFIFGKGDDVLCRLGSEAKSKFLEKAEQKNEIKKSMRLLVQRVLENRFGPHWDHS